MIVVDTNVVSELMRPSPAAGVASWVRARGTELFTTSVTVAEIRYCIERLPAGTRRDQLRAIVATVFEAYAEHVLAFDAAAAETYADVVIRRERLGAPIDGFDAQIAAICRTHSAVLATRNTRDFKDTGTEVFDPWQGIG